MYRTYNTRPVPRPTPPKRRFPVEFLLVPAIAVVIIAAYCTYALARPMDAPKVTPLPPVISGQVGVKLPWPTVGEGAIGAVGYGLLASHGDQTPVPTASVAKVITALAILQRHPLKPGEQGPEITMTQADVDRYNAYVAEDGSVVPVSAGEKITEYQALQAMMLPSANNMADTMAIWTFGSLDAYRTYATSLVKQFGMTQTTIGKDASGFDPSTVSTSHDLVLLGLQALQNPVLSEIVGQRSAVFPGYGTMSNVNTLLGTHGIRGIKTGNTDQAGGCLLIAADVPVNGQTITVITAIMAAPTLRTTMKDTVPLLQASASAFRPITVVSPGQSVGTVSTDWGETTNLTATKGINVLAWNGSAFSPKETIKSLHTPVPADTNVGTMSVAYQGRTQTADITTASPITGPSVFWRLTHPF